MDENQQLRCPHCGRAQMFDDKVCPYCGQPLSGRKKYVTVKQKAREQRAIQHRDHHREDRKETYIPMDSQGVWTGPEEKRDPDVKKVNTKKLIIGVVIAVACTQLLPLAVEVLENIGTLVEDSFEKNQEPDMPEIYIPDMHVLDDLDDLATMDIGGIPLDLPTDEPEEFYTISAEENEELLEDALWYHRERWREEIPDLEEGQLELLEAAAVRVEGEDSQVKILEKLQEDGYDQEKAQWALDTLKVDWNVQALRCMLGYLRYSSFTPADMAGQLDYEKFTEEQIQYAMENCQVDWYYQLEMEANDRFRYYPYSRDGFVWTLEEWGFQQEDIDRYMETLDVDWKAQALDRANLRLENYNYSREEMTEYLQEEGFIEEEIQYALENIYD